MGAAKVKPYFRHCRVFETKLKNKRIERYYFQRPKEICNTL